jgi:hypothetical protein
VRNLSVPDYAYQVTIMAVRHSELKEIEFFIQLDMLAQNTPPDMLIIDQFNSFPQLILSIPEHFRYLYQISVYDWFLYSHSEFMGYAILTDDLYPIIIPASMFRDIDAATDIPSF